MPGWLRGDVLGIEAWQIIGLALLVIIGITLRRLVIHLVTTYVRRLTRRLKGSVVDRVVAKAGGPLGTLAVAASFALGGPLLQFSPGGAFVIMLAARTLAAFSVVWPLYRLVDVLTDIMEARAAKTESKLDDQLVPLLRKSLKLFFVVIGSIFILQNLDVDVGSLLAGLGLGGLAFALAAKDTVANFFGSIMVFIDKPFQIGDWILMAPDIEGTVEEVGFRTSRIRTFYDSVITVPNANVTNTPIDNMGRRRYRRYKTTLGLTYDTAPEKVQAFCEGVRAILQSLPAARKDYYLVEFRDFGASALEVFVYCFFETPDWSSELRARTCLNLSIMRLAASLGVSFAFPTQTLHIAPPAATDAASQSDEQSLQAVIRAFGPGGEQALPSGFALSHGYEPRQPDPPRPGDES
jgi:MscS family membrane protein